MKKRLNHKRYTLFLINMSSKFLDCYQNKKTLIFRAPAAEGKAKTNTNVVIFLIDTSGSMSGDFPYIAVRVNKVMQNSPDTIFHILTFDSTAKDRGHSSLPTKLPYGGTNIRSGIELLIETVNKYIDKNNKNITVVFVSDGADGNPTALDKYMKGEMIHSLSKLRSSDVSLDFICFGIGEGFPTKIAMNFRNCFHTGRDKIPNAIIAKSFTDDHGGYHSRVERYDDYFAELGSYFSLVPKMSVSVKVAAAPWQGCKKTEVYGDSWYIIENPDQESIVIDGTLYKLVKKPWSMYALIDNFKQWGHAFNAYCLRETDKSNMKKVGQRMYDEMTAMVALLDDQVQSVESIAEYAKLTCKNRLQKAMRKQNAEINTYLMMFKSVADGNYLSNMTDQALADRLAVGTHTGKYTERSAKMRGIVDENEFNMIKREFIDAFDKHIDYLDDTKADEVMDTDTVALQNTYDIILEEGLEECIRDCPNQYVLLDSVLPCIGMAFYVERNDAASINPYAIKVVSQPMLNRTIGTIALLEYQRNTEAGNIGHTYGKKSTEIDPQGHAKIPIGNGSNDMINAIIPMFKSVDDTLKPFVRTRLYSLMSTWGVMRNADSIVHEAVLAGLAQVLCYCVTPPESSQKHELLGMIIPTLDMLYKGRPMFDKYLSKLCSNEYYQCMVTSAESLDVKCEAMSKPLLFLWYAKAFLPLDLKKKVLKSVYIETIGRLTDNLTLDDLFIIKKCPEKLQDKLDKPMTIETLMKESDLMAPEKYYTIAEYKSAISNAFREWNEDFQKEYFEVEYGLDMSKLDKLYNRSIGDVNLNRLRQFSKHYLGSNIEDELNLNTIVLFANKSSFDRHCNDDLTQKQLPSNTEAHIAICHKLVNTIKGKFKGDVVDKLLNDADGIYTKRWHELHELAVPLSKDEIVKLKGYDFWDDECQKVVGTVKLPDNTMLQLKNYNPESNLLRDSCMCPKCPFFLQGSTKIMNHLHPWVARNEWAPALHKAVKRYHTRPSDYIWQKIIDKELINGTQTPVLYNKNALLRQVDTFKQDIDWLKCRYTEIKMNDTTFVDELIKEQIQ